MTERRLADLNTRLDEQHAALKRELISKHDQMLQETADNRQKHHLCPSCSAKGAAALAAFLREEVLAELGHAQWVFSIPKRFRPYLLFTGNGWADPAVRLSSHPSIMGSHD